MSERFISVIPARPGHFVSIQNIDWDAQRRRYKEFGPWAVVLAWGFTEYGGPPIPFHIAGHPSADESAWKIKDPTGAITLVNS